jgi:hypothetical protein
MQSSEIYKLDVHRLVDQITTEIGDRCRWVERFLDEAQKLSDYTATVTSFVECMNFDFFRFI